MKTTLSTMILVAVLGLAGCGGGDSGADAAGRDARPEGAPVRPPAVLETEAAAEVAAEEGSSDMLEQPAEASAAESVYEAVITTALEISGLLDELGPALDDLSALNQLDQETRDRLSFWSEAIRTSLRGGDVDTAAGASRNIRDELDRLVDEGFVDAETAEEVKRLIDEIEDRVGTLGEVGREEWTWPDFSPDCEWYEPIEPTMLWVDSAAVAGGDGSPTSPFTTIEEALSEADGLDTEAVRLHLGTGLYVEDVVVTRDTDLVGGADVRIAGSVVGDQAHRLWLQNVKILGGAVTVADPCAATRIQDVVFEEPPGTAVVHRGGYLSSVRTDVIGHGGPGSAAAFTLSDGARAELALVSIQATARGLHLSGSGTDVVSVNLSVDALDDPEGPAIAVTAGASLRSVATLIQSVHGSGLIAVDDAVVEAVFLAVDGVSHGLDPAGESIYARGVVADDIGRIEITEFDIGPSEGAGVYLGSELAGFYLHRGVVHHGAFGAWVEIPASLPAEEIDLLLDRLRDGVIYRDNGLNLAAPFLPAPPSP